MKDELEIELKEIVTWTTISKDRITRLYDAYSIISKSNQKHCSKCPSVIRGIFKKVKRYYEKNYI